MSHRRLIVAVIAVLTVLAPVLTVAPAGAQPEPEPRFRALVFSKVTGFYHESIPDGKATIAALGEEHDFAVDINDDSAVFSDEGLAPYDVVIFNNTNSNPGDDLLNAEQRAAFQRYVAGGGGYAGIHSASGSERDWEWYEGLVGAIFRSHPPIQEVTIDVADRQHPSTSGLPKEWIRSEEPYDFLTNPRGDVHVLATFDTLSYDGDVMGPDHPIAWCQDDYEGGRSWYTGLGHASSAFTDEPLFREHILGGIEWAAGAVDGECGATNWDNYERVQLDGNTDDPLDLDIDEQGRVFFVERGGAVKVYLPEEQRTFTAADLDVFVQHTHGMHGIALDPDFETNRWLYVYYSPTGDRDVILLSRFTFDDLTNTLDLASEEVVLEVESQRDVNAHEGGAIDFDAEGNLYLATGDNSFPCCSGFGATDERPGQETSDAGRSSANTNDLRGKILRITPQDDGTYTVPDGNLFAPGTPETLPEIYAMGMRNPYRMHVDSETGWVYWGDVGPDARNDSPTRGPRGYDEFNQARAAGNFGWPYCIGPNLPYVDYDFGTGATNGTYDCENGPTNDSPNNDGLPQLPPGQPAWIWYPYANSPEFPTLGTGGRLAVGGPTYHYDPELFSETKFPEYYDDTVFIAEWTRNALFEVKLDDAGQPLSVNPFMADTDFLRPIDMEFGPDGNLYVIEWGSNYGGSGRGDPNSDSGIYRIGYAREGARTPVAKATADPRSGGTPLEVQFSSAGSEDPDEGDTISFAWDFEPDGTVDSTDPNPTHTYTTPGNYTAQLTVTDSTGLASVANVPISVGNTAPEVTLEEPLDGQIFEFGDAIDFAVDVTDAEDGSSTDGGIDCADVVVQPELGHDQHAHPLELYSGCEGTIRTLPDSGHDPDTDDMYYVVDASYEDMGAPGVEPLTSGDSAVLRLRRTQAEHYTSAEGLALFDSGDGGRMVGDTHHGDYLSLEPVNLRGISQIRFRVASAGLGGTMEIRTDSPDGQLVGSVEVEPTGGGRTFTTVVAPVEDPGGTHELFFVFTRNPGDVYLFNLDWIQFENPLTDPLKAARREALVLGDQVGTLQEDGALTAAQAAELDGRVTTLLDDLDAAIAAAGSDGFDGAVEQALATADALRQWIVDERDDGALSPEAADVLLPPAERTVALLSQLDADQEGLIAALEPAAPEVVVGETVELEATVTNDGTEPVTDITTEVQAPEGWTIEPTSATGTDAVAPGASFTATYDATVPADAATGVDVTVAGTATYTTTGGGTGRLPITADVTVLSAAGVTLDAPDPFLGGRENLVDVTVQNRRSSASIDVDAALDVPAGWTAETAAATVAAGETAVLQVPVTPPLDVLTAGVEAPVGLPATVTVDGTTLDEALVVEVLPVPDGEQAVLALDAGTASSPLLDTYQRLAPGTVWSAGQGFGWIAGTPDSRNRTGAGVLRDDFTWSGTDRDAATLRITVPPGPQDGWLLTGDSGFQASDTVVEIDGERVADTGGSPPPGEFRWLRFRIDGGEAGREVDLRLIGEGIESYWRLNALVVLPATEVTAPTVTPTLAGEQDGDGAYIDSVTVTLDAADEEGGSGLASVEYTLDSDEWLPYEGPFTVDEPGDHTLTYRATDAAGNVSDVGTVTFTIVADEPDPDPTPTPTPDPDPTPTPDPDPTPTPDPDPTPTPNPDPTPTPNPDPSPDPCDCEEPGEPGPAGPPGPSGPEGPAGPAGPPGQNGENGQNGQNGQNGANGRDGRDGQDGRDGRDGPAGPGGPAGPTGPSGPTGPTGPTGPQGPAGPTGPQGPGGGGQGGAGFGPQAAGVSRMAGEDRIATAAALSAASFQPGVPVAFVATPGSFADALSAGPAAAELGGPILLAGQDLPAATAEELARLRPERVVVVGGEAAVSGAVAEQLASFTERAVERFAGADRFATSAAVSAAVFEPGAPVFAATGGNFPDALAGGVAAGVAGGPVLLVGQDVPAPIQTELARLGSDSVTVLGGEQAVSAAVAEQLAASGADVTRAAGADRFATAAAIAEVAFPQGAETVYVATGAVFADALAGTPVAALAGAPVLLVTADDIPAATAAALDRLTLANVVVLGGEAAIGDDVARELGQATNG